MKVLVTGKGQLASALKATAPQRYQVWMQGRDVLDITDSTIVGTRVAALKPEVVINAAAYTGVDAAETNQERAYAVNAEGAENIADAAASIGARVVHISTDFVFDGRLPLPYLPNHPPNPLGVYGASKLEGERRVFDRIPEALVIRTAWVYAETGNNFVRTVLKLCGERPFLNIVYDQVGTPTWATSLAKAIWRAVERGVSGLHHWTDRGVASWYDFAMAIQDEALGVGLVKKPVPIHPIRTAQYPTPARRPAYSVLDHSELARLIEWHPDHWRDNLRQMIWNLRNA